MPLISDIVRLMEDIAPTCLAEKWDNTGLLLGDLNSETSRVMICLDVTREVVEEAITKKVDLIISHHPLFFDPIKSLRTDNFIGEITLSLIKNNISVFCAHTNLDKAEFGTDYALAALLGLEDIRTVVSDSFKEQNYKIVVFIPIGSERYVLDAMADAGGGKIGDYSHCAFSTQGIGTFLPLEGANPSIGKIGRVENVKETRLEISVPSGKLQNVLSAMISAHPYEEVAYDVYQLSDCLQKHGFGRIGTIAAKTTIRDYAKYVCKLLNIDHVGVIGDLDREIQKVAVCAGSGAELALLAKQCGADLFLTGEVKHHIALELKNSGLALLTAGHYATEAPVLALLFERLQKLTCALQYNVELSLSRIITEPFHLYINNSNFTPG